MVRQRVRAGEDRRKYMVHLTAEGHEWVGRVLGGYMDSLVEEFGALSADERDELGRLCRKLGRGKRGEDMGGR